MLLAACGGRASDPGAGMPSAAGAAGTLSAVGAAGSSSNGAGAASGGAASGGDSTGTGPIDTTGLPTEFPALHCDGPLASLQLVLPCKVGMPQNGNNVVECSDATGQAMLTFFVSMATAARSIGIPSPVPGGPNQGVSSNGPQYVGTVEGLLTFTQVDPAARAFVGRLSKGTVTWRSAQGDETVCGLSPTILWATAGDFL